MTKRYKMLALLMKAVVIAVAIWGIVTLVDVLRYKDPYTVVYPMTNQHVDWTGAGYSGIWRR